MQQTIKQPTKKEAFELAIKAIQLFPAAFNGSDVEAVIKEAEKVWNFLKSN
jgi:hypothetical protein